MLRYLVRESLSTQGVQTAAEAATPRELTPQDRHDNVAGVVVLCLSGPRQVWRQTIEETRRTLPGGRVVAVTFGHEGVEKDLPSIDHRLGADTLVHAPAPPEELRDAVLRAKHVRTSAPTS